MSFIMQTAWARSGAWWSR